MKHGVEALAYATRMCMNEGIVEDHLFGTHLSVGGCQLPKERLLYSSDIRRSQFKVRVNKLDRSQ
jgi:hypothetical protein